MKYVKILRGENNNEIENPAYEFKFNCDHFQKHSMQCISKDQHVLVTAHTGSGKTAIAIYAIAHNLRKGKKIIYTSPIKALSNQKYKELREIFEHEFSQKENKQYTVGLITGDNNINPSADCLIVTTEILRNALYDIGDENDTKKEMYIKNNILNDLGCVIFDEVHYINDKDRGHIWEETLILLKSDVTLVMLSATIDRAEEFANWIGKNKNSVVNLVPTNKRVVPLEHYIYAEKKIYKIQNRDNKFIDSGCDKCYKIYKLKRRSASAMINECVAYMKEKNLLPVIFFVFSRKNCEKYAKQLTRSLINHEERKEIEKIFWKYIKDHQEKYRRSEQYQLMKKILLNGIAFHHSGLLPVLKEIVEILFQKGLIRVLFATETFAVGINMPAKTTIFVELEKYTENGRRFLTTSEYKQMAGRAGRRGIDKLGTVIILPIYDYPEKENLKEIMLGKIAHVESKFEIDYQFILKIILSKSERAEDFINKSLFHQNSIKSLENYRSELIKLKEILTDLDQKVENKNLLEKYLDLLNREYEYKQSYIKMTKQEIREKNKILRSIPKLKKKIYNKYYDTKNRLLDVEYYIYETENYVVTESSKMLKLLDSFNYIKNINGENLYSLNESNATYKGLIAAQINDCNPILLMEILSRKILLDLDSKRIAAILSIFVEDKIHENIFDMDNMLKEKIKKIEQIVIELVEKEKEYGINLHLYDYWEISYNLIMPIYLWAQGEDYKKIQNELDIYEGTFIKNILKVNNIARDLIKLCKISNNIELIPKLNKIQEELVRDIVTVDSLYF